MNGLFRTTVGLGVVALFAGAMASAFPGDLDRGFGDGGVVVTATAPGAGSDFQNGLAIENSGRILVGGESDMGTAGGGDQWRVSRYKPNGELDPTFGTGGTALTSMSDAGGEDEHIWQLALQGDGKIVAAGDARTAAGGFDIALVRYNADGTLDTSFGSGGRVTTAIAPTTRRDTAFEVVIDGQGRIVAGGFVDAAPADGGRNFALVRYNANGTLDTSFDGDGIVVTAVAPGPNQEVINGVAFDANGKIVVGGHANMGAGAGGLNRAHARYNPNGSLDTTFGGDGIVITAAAPGDNAEFGLDLALDADGKILSGGIADMTGAFTFDLALIRYGADGSFDTSFGTDGVVTTNVGPGDTDDDLEGLVIQPGGNIIVGGSSGTTFLVDSDFMVVRYKPDGSLDDSFGNGGIATTNTAAANGSDEIYEIALKSDGKLVASGECDQASTGRDICVARYKVGEGD